MEATQKVFDAMKKNANPMRPGEIAEAAGIDKKEAEKAIKVLVSEGKIHSPKRCFYAPK